jgi:DNA-binding transcriptional regulator YdaS (Cro superfamily)
MYDWRMDQFLPHPLDRYGVRKAIKALGISTQSITQWRTNRVPAEHCPAIEQVTNGMVRCEELRPDIPWGVLRNKQPESMEK